MKRLLVLATSNAKKGREIQALLQPLPVQVLLLKDVCGPVRVPEPFNTFRENAAYKALWSARLCGEWSLGEDSGLEVDALSGRPGVYSARFAGAEAPDEKRVELLLRLLEGLSDDQRTARFRCVVALAAPPPHGILGAWEGACEGRIVTQPRGSFGFGYDPIFVANGQTRTNAELTPEEKNAISHRGIALRLFARDFPIILRNQQSCEAVAGPANASQYLPRETAPDS